MTRAVAVTLDLGVSGVVLASRDAVEVYGESRRALELASEAEAETEAEVARERKEEDMLSSVGATVLAKGGKSGGGGEGTGRQPEKSERRVLGWLVNCGLRCG